MRLSGRDSGKTSLSPIDPEELLMNLKLTTGKAAEFCDISRRQLCYWTDKGIVETVEGEDEEYGEEGTRRVYDFSALTRVLLIKQLLEQGRGLKRATREVESYLQQREDEELEADADRRTREDILQRLTARLEELAASRAHIIPGHDPLVLARYPALTAATSGQVHRVDLPRLR